MKKSIASCLLVVTVACGGGSTVTGPETPVATPTPDMTPSKGTGIYPVPPPTVADGWDASFGANASFNVKNTGSRARAVYAYTTGFDNQGVVLDSRVAAVVNNGDAFSGTFNATCVQLDLSTEAVGGRPDIGFAYFDRLGQVFSPSYNPEKVTECRRGNPTPGASR